MAGDGEQEQKPEETLEEKLVAATPAEERGDKSMLVKGPTFELAGHTYRMRRLGYTDHSRFAGILQQALRHGKIDLVGAVTKGQATELIQMMVELVLGALTYAPNELFGFLASVLGIDRPTILDPERFPFASLPMVLTKLTEHPDLQDFFVEIGALIEGRKAQLLSPTPPSSGPPISSPDATETPTITS